MHIKLDKEIVDGIYDHALKEYPDECCGIVTGNDAVRTLHRCVNIQNRLHAEDPGRFPRDARTAYVIDRAEFDSIVSASRKKGEDVLVLYHSHCDHDAYFSDEDVAAQTVFGEPEFPDAIHMVVSVINRQIRGVKFFVWDTEKKTFRPLSAQQ
jgi:proteasome lid subunit RPN8/RPN11